MDDEAVDRLLRRASVQHGAFRYDQAQELGVGERYVRRQVRLGAFRLAHPGVLVVVGRPPAFLSDLSAAVLARPGSAASHRAAACLHGLDGFEQAPVEITVRRSQDGTLPGVVVHRTGQLTDDDLVVVRGIRVTTRERLLCDLGAVVDVDRLEQAVDAYLRSGGTEDDVRSVLARIDRPGPSGAGRLRRVLALPHRQAALPESWFERLVHKLLVSSRLPPIELQYELRVAGRFVARFDAAIPLLRVGIEAHSDAWHHGARRGERDRQRDRRIAEHGWERVYLSWREVQQPAEAEASLLHLCRQRAPQLGIDPATWRALP